MKSCAKVKFKFDSTSNLEVTYIEYRERESKIQATLPSFLAHNSRNKLNKIESIKIYAAAKFLWKVVKVKVYTCLQRCGRSFHRFCEENCSKDFVRLFGGRKLRCVNSCPVGAENQKIVC